MTELYRTHPVLELFFITTACYTTGIVGAFGQLSPKMILAAFGVGTWSFIIIMMGTASQVHEIHQKEVDNQ
jgi:hypothetical protein